MALPIFFIGVVVALHAKVAVLIWLAAKQTLLYIG